MKHITTGCLFICIALFASCSTSVEAPGPDEGLVLIYVEEIHKPVQAPRVMLHISGMESPLGFKVRSPAASARFDLAGSYGADSWSAADDVLLNGGEAFEFSVEQGGVTLLPYKVMLVGKKQVEIRRMTDLDIQFAEGQFAMHPDFRDLQITYPDSP